MNLMLYLSADIIHEFYIRHCRSAGIESIIVSVESKPWAFDEAASSFPSSSSSYCPFSITNMAEDEATEFSGAHKSPLPLAVTLTEASGEAEKAKAKGWKRSAVVFGMAGVSNMAGSFVTNPVNVVKVRMQLDGALSSNHERKYRGLVSGMFYIGRQEGLKGLFRGTGAALMREASYSSIRMGAYEPFKRALGGHDPAHTPLWIKVGAGSAAGIVGSAVANPTDVVIVRMQSSSLEKSVMGEWRYSGPFQALASIAKNEGIRGLYRGITPTIQRAGILNAVQVPTYDHAKHILLNANILQEGVPCHLVSSALAGFVTAIVITPIDLIKTRIMQQAVDINGKGILFSSSFDCFKKTLKSEGVLSLYKGFIPVWMRIFPHTIVTFFVFEQLRKATGIAPV